MALSTLIIALLVLLALALRGRSGTHRSCGAGGCPLTSGGGPGSGSQGGGGCSPRVWEAPLVS